MRLLEKDWNARGGVALVRTAYPDEPIAAFMDWLRTTSAWQEDVEMVHRRLRVLDRQLADIRNARALKAAQLAKAREAKRQRRLAAAGG